MNQDDSLNKQNEKKFKTIGEVAKIFNIEQHVLRFWEEKFKEIKPLKRRGRRLYSQDDIDHIKKIKDLLYEKGYTIKGVQKLFKYTKKTSEITQHQYKVYLDQLLSEMIKIRDYLKNITKL